MPVSTEGMSRTARRAFYERLLPARAQGRFLETALGDADMDFDLVPAWQQRSPRFARDAQILWQRLDALPPGESGEARAAQIAACAYQDRTLIGVSTLYLEYVPRFRARVGLYRHIVAPEHRRRLVSNALIVYSRELLAAWSRAHPAEGVAAMAAVIEADVGQALRRPVWPNSNLILAAYTPDGRQVRLSWFDHVRLD